MTALKYQIQRENNELHSYNPYYTDEDEPYILPENLFDIRRLSDSSLDRNLEEHDQYGGALTEEMLRCAREDLNQMDDQKRRTDRDDNLSNLLIDPSHSDGMYLKILHVKQKAKIINVCIYYIIGVESSMSDKTMKQSTRHVITTL